MFLENVLQEYLYDCQLRKLSERTVKSLKNNNRRFFYYLKNTFDISTLEDVRRGHIQAYVSYLSDLGRKETYINSLIKSFRCFFAYCEQEEYINESPIKKLKFQKEEITIIRTFNDEEVKKMVSCYSGRTYLEQRNRCIIVLLVDSGIRNSELCNVKLEDVLDNAIRIHGKGKKVRYVPLTPSINKALVRYLRSREGYIKDKFNYQTQYLFLSQKGKKLTPETIERVVKECGEMSGVRDELRCSPHSCRHFYAQSQLRNGCDLFTLSKLLGHSNINITKRYLNSMNVNDVLEIAQKYTPLRYI